MSDKDEEHYRCPHCGVRVRTSAGLSSHISQSTTCLNRTIANNQPAASSKRPRSESPALGGGEDPTSNDPATNDHYLYPPLLTGQQSTKRARVEDEEDVPIKKCDFFSEFKPPAGTPQQKPPGMSSDFGRLQESQRALGSEPWAPFSSTEEWDFARWILGSDLSQKQIDALLALDMVRKPECTLPVVSSIVMNCKI